MFDSLFIWSNEVINIWTHLLGFLVFALMTVYDNAVVIPHLGGHATDHFMITFALFCFQFCLLSSAGYHLFMCHSEKANRRWLSMDLAGISIGMIGCYLPGVHYAYYCLSVWRDIYLIIISILFGAVLYYQTSPRYQTPSWFTKRILIYADFCSQGCSPVLDNPVCFCVLYLQVSRTMVPWNL